MTVYFYHTQDSRYIYNEWKAGRFPSHLLYGACELPSEGIEVIIHPTINQQQSRWRKMIMIAWDIIKHYRKFDAVYATKQNGLDLIILLRALGLFRKPVILWHHQPILSRNGFLKRCLAKFYLSGIDHMFMFSDNIVKVSAATGLVAASKLQQCPWGADLGFYNRLRNENPTEHEGYISTGKERRDMPTLIEAFRDCHNLRLEILVPADFIGTKYEKELSVISQINNITLYINRTLWIPGIAKRIWPHKCICICCTETNYTVGLTTLVEALAFGLPVIISRNPNLPFDVSEQQCGISVPYRDINAWKKAIQKIESDSEGTDAMKIKAELLAKTTYNINNCAHIVASAIRTYCKQ